MGSTAMARGHLREQHVQRIATEWLAEHCRQRTASVAVEPLLEAGVSHGSRYGRGRADGLIAARLEDGSIHTIAIEAKSRRTLFNLAEYSSDDPWLLHGLLVGALGAFAGAVVGWFGGSLLVGILLAVTGFVALGLGYLKLTEDHQRYKVIDAVTQVQRYPANERWIAISTDALNALRQGLQDQLCSQCERAGVGLLRVSFATSVTVLKPAVSQATPTQLRDYLQCYARGDAVRQRILQSRSAPS